MKSAGWHIALPGGAPMPTFHRATREEAIDAFTRAKRLKWKAAYMRGYRCQPSKIVQLEAARHA